MDLKQVIKDPIYLALVIFVIIAMFFGGFYGNFLILFLGWNLLLAGFTYFLVDIFIYLRKKRSHIALVLLIWFMFILFFPNTIYVMTDFIHLENYQFFIDYAEIYRYVLMDWVVLMIITIGALLAAKIGIESLEKMKPYHFEWIKKHYVIYLGLLFLASSIGIYIGRFIRLNSWEFHQIVSVIPQIIQKFSFFIGFIGIYMMIHLTAYFVMSSHAIGYTEIRKQTEE
ncbi:MAG: DUF1361 domain-containing protein [Acholeplasmataceae bacterium]|jgi:uncharacterized membrane protein|nr:DUF1361 domain-containing protein [Acholeplasmataceae bacterium]